jgi:hypothetical protein
MELLIYVGILGVTASLGTAIFLTTLRSYWRNQAQDEVTQNLRSATQVISHQISQATGVNGASSTLNLAMADSSKNPTIFFLSGGTLFMQQGAAAPVALTSLKVSATSVAFSLVSALQTQIDPVDHWAWSGGASSTSVAGEGLGWIDFSPAIGDVRIPVGTSGELFGYAYAEGTGYISLNCQSTNSCSAVSYKVLASATGTLSGWAWSDVVGWISFNASDTTSTIPYGVWVDSSTGELFGWAWSENVGWISFNCANPEVNSCAAAPYKVKAIKKLGRPINTVQITMTIAYQAGGNPILNYSDSVNFSAALAQPSNVTVAAISPASGTSTVNITSITGTNFQNGAIVKLAKGGLLDIYPTDPFEYLSATSLQSGAFDVSGAVKGFWDVVVINPDGQIGVLPAGFEIQ